MSNLLSNFRRCNHCRRRSKNKLECLYLAFFSGNVAFASKARVLYYKTLQMDIFHIKQVLFTLSVTNIPVLKSTLAYYGNRILRIHNGLYYIPQEPVQECGDI